MTPMVLLAGVTVKGGDVWGKFGMDLKSATDLTKTLSDYSSTFYTYMEKLITNVTFPLAAVILSLLVILEFTVIARKIAANGGALTGEALVPFLIRFLFVIAFLSQSKLIVETIVSFGAWSVEKAALVFSSGKADFYSVAGVKGKGIAGMAIVIVLGLFQFLFKIGAVVTANVLISLRFLQLYTMLPFAPIATATLVSDEWRSVGLGYYKNIIAYSVQGLVIFIVLSLYSLIPVNLAEGALSGGNFFGVFVNSIVQPLLLLIALAGSQRTARSILGM